MRRRLRPRGKSPIRPQKLFSNYCFDRDSFLWRSGNASARGDPRGTSENSKGQNLLDDAHGFSAALHTIIGLPVVRQAFLVEFTKTRFIAEERPVTHEYTPFQKVFRRAIQPDDDGPGAPWHRPKFTDERGVARLCERAPAERQ